MKWLLLSSATGIKVLNFSNHGQAKPAGEREARCRPGGGRRVPRHGGTLVCARPCAPSAAFPWGPASAPTAPRNGFTGWVGVKGRWGCARGFLLFRPTGRLRGNGLGCRGAPGNGGEPSPLPVGLAWMLDAAQHRIMEPWNGFGWKGP